MMYVLQLKVMCDDNCRSKKFDLSQDTIRYYELIGMIPGVRRNKGGNRDYSENECRWVEFAKCMRRADLPIEALIEYVISERLNDKKACESMPFLYSA